jgi:ribosomal protein S18 acetylase RimI-like enzyme
VTTDSELYGRGINTLLACWEENACGASRARVTRAPGVTAAVFPSGPERGVYNNAVLDCDLGPAERSAAIDAMEASYADAGIAEFAAWVHESDEGMSSALRTRGYSLNETTRAMGMSLADAASNVPAVELAPSDWGEYLRILGLPGLLGSADHAAFHVLIARAEGQNVATAMAFDAERDCGIFNVATLDRARRRGLGTALTSRHLHDARARGCSTASLQSTEIGERVYASVGFRDLGRILEYVP